VEIGLTVQIDIFVKDRPYGTRRWKHVPRRGDYIKLDGKEAGWHKIKEVNWHGDDYPVVSLIL
jgi:hypothetical protein